MRVIVTGGCGFIGSHLVDQLVKEGHEVLIIDNLHSGTLQYVPPSVKLHVVDIRDKRISSLFSQFRPDVVYHLAAQIDVQQSLCDPHEDADINVLGTLNVLHQCITYHVSKLVFASTAAIYGHPEKLPVMEQHLPSPISCYGLSKLTCEKYIQLYATLHSLTYTILRFANVYGERQQIKGEGGVICIFFNRLLQHHRPVIYGDGQQTRDFIYVKDVVEANMLAMKHGDNEIFNVSTNHPVSVHDVFYTIAKLRSTNITPKYEHSRPGDIVHSYLGNQHLRDCLQWKPRYNIETGLQETSLHFS